MRKRISRMSGWCETLKRLQKKSGNMPERTSRNCKTPLVWSFTDHPTRRVILTPSEKKLRIQIVYLFLDIPRICWRDYSKTQTSRHGMGYFYGRTDEESQRWRKLYIKFLSRKTEIRRFPHYWKKEVVSRLQHALHVQKTGNIILETSAKTYSIRKNKKVSPKKTLFLKYICIQKIILYTLLYTLYNLWNNSHEKNNYDCIGSKNSYKQEQSSPLEHSRSLSDMHRPDQSPYSSRISFTNDGSIEISMVPFNFPPIMRRIVQRSYIFPSSERLPVESLSLQKKISRPPYQYQKNWPIEAHNISFSVLMVIPWIKRIFLMVISFS